jgi:hypothetical protein
MRKLPPHNHHQAEPEEQKRQSGCSVLDADHFMISREHPLPPETGIVMMIFVGIVRVSDGGGHTSGNGVKLKARVRWTDAQGLGTKLRSNAQNGY